MNPPLRLFNTLSKKIEVFDPVKKGKVGLYTCGPTVYNYAHIGNLRTYIFEDILQRTLEWNGYAVKRAMNITDVGHLTSDADAGEDKIDREARKKNITPAEIASFYTKAFLSDIKKLHIKVPPILAPATKFIPQQIEIIKQLFKKGYAYETSRAIYFDVDKFRRYGRLSGQSLKQKMVAARKEVVADPQKKNPADFVLWFKLVGKFEHHALRWQSPWGKGFPGWHIECSAISRNFLGQPFDIHTGGIDLIGTHHENEIAQSEAAYGKPLARYWMHGEFLLVDKAKMAKSEGNFFTLEDLEKKGFSPLAYRYLVLGTHYRARLNFSWESLRAAQNGLQNLYSEVHELSYHYHGLHIKPKLNWVDAMAYENSFEREINNDLNTPAALSRARALLRVKAPTPKKLALLKKFDRILGLNLAHAMELSSAETKIPPEIYRLANQREQCRSSQQFIKADHLRNEINRLGYIVEDTPEGPVIKSKK